MMTARTRGTNAFRAVRLLTAAVVPWVAACAPADAPAPATTAAPAEPVVVATGLNAPMGVLVDTDGTLWITDSGLGGDDVLRGVIPGTDQVAELRWGRTARLVRIAPDGTSTDVLQLPSFVLPDGPQGAGHLAMQDGVLFLTSAGWSDWLQGARPADMGVVMQLVDGVATELSNTWDIERTANPDGALVETNPFDVTVGPDGGLWVTDAAGNTLLRVDIETGAVEVRAVFDVVPGPIPNAARGGAQVIEPVPTAVAFDTAGLAFVSLLPGFPFLPGSGSVVRVTMDGTITSYATGLTMITDLVTGPDGRLWAVSLGQFTEQGPVPNSGAVLRIAEGATHETVLSGLPFPTALAFGANGDAYVTLHGVGEPGSGQVMKYGALATRPSPGR